jgi:hypothetical protein
MTTIVTLEQLETAANASLDFHMDKGQVFWQNEQNRPLLRDLMAAAKPFPGSKENLTERVAGEYATGIEGFQYDDEVGYSNPAKIKTATYPWKLIHGGINVTMQELLENGISVSNTANGTGITKISGSDAIVLADLFDYKMEDMKGGMAKDMDEMLWGDGTADSLLVPGIRSIIVDDPTDSLVVGGIDQAANTWWRNYASLDLVTTTPSDLNVLTALQQGLRQMRRYGSPTHKVYAGSDFIDAINDELRSKGNFTMTGWAGTGGGTLDGSIGNATFDKLPLTYAPTMDDLGLEKFCYFVDTKVIKVRPIEGEDMKKHTPSRPHNKYVLYRATTWAGGLTARQRNTSGVFSIA